MKILIVGGGKTVYFLCRTFASKGHDVTVIAPDHAECTAMARRLRATVICADGSNPLVLQEAGAEAADAVLAVTPNDEDNLVVCQLAALRFKVPRVLAAVSDPDNEAAFQRLRVPAFSTTRAIAEMIEMRSALDTVHNVFSFGGGRVNFTEVILEAASPVVGKQLLALDLPANALIATIQRGSEVIVPHGEATLRAGDRVVLVTVPENHGPVLKMLTGEPL